MVVGCKTHGELTHPQAEVSIFAGSKSPDPLLVRHMWCGPPYWSTPTSFAKVKKSVNNVHFCRLYKSTTIRERKLIDSSCDFSGLKKTYWRVCSKMGLPRTTLGELRAFPRTQRKGKDMKGERRKRKGKLVREVKGEMWAGKREGREGEDPPNVETNRRLCPQPQDPCN